MVGPGGGSAHAASYAFPSLGYYQTACSRWERVVEPDTPMITFTGTVDGTVRGEFWYEYQNRWTRYARLLGTAYHMTLAHPPVGAYQLCWSHTTPGPDRASGILTATVSYDDEAPVSPDDEGETDLGCPISDDDEESGFVTQSGEGDTGCLIYADINAKRPFLSLSAQAAFTKLVDCLVNDRKAYTQDADGVLTPRVFGDALDREVKHCNLRLLPALADGTSWKIRFANDEDYWEKGGCQQMHRALEQKGFALVYLRHRSEPTDEDATFLGHAVSVERVACTEDGGGRLTIRDPQKPDLLIHLTLNAHGYLIDVEPKAPTGTAFYADTWVSGGYVATPPAPPQ
jgi:hypothetical protein